MKPSEFTLKAIRKTYIKTFGMPKVCLPQEKNRDVVSDIIYKFLADDKPCMIARYGATELSMVVNYLGITTKTHSIYRFIKGQEPEWWWNHNIMMQMQQWSGFFPPTEEKLSQFCRLMLDDAKEMDICGVFSSVEPLMRYVEPYMSSPLYVPLYTYSPFVSTRPWSRILKGKKVLVIHPFAELIVRQYQRREQLFDNPDVLPEFDLKVIKAVQSLGGESNGFADWFEALQYMKNEMDRTDYDICLIGCGAYGFPLAAHAKRQGKKAIHFGGELQLLFGIKGSRWEDPLHAIKCGLPQDFYQKLFTNPAWVRPEEYKNAHSLKVENACYW